jgi:endonuclease G, mitochondrial
MMEHIPQNQFPLSHRPEDLEIVIKEVGRPSFIIQNGTFPPNPIDVTSDDPRFWATLLEPQRQVINQVIQSVGQIQSRQPATNTAAPATGWLIAPNIIVTNRHVVNELGEDLRIDFRQEVGSLLQEEYALKLVYKSDMPQVDMAFLEIIGRPLDPAIQPIALFDGVILEKARVMTIGYPVGAADRTAGQTFEADKAGVLLKTIFGDFKSKKALQPGEIRQLETDRLGHDCSTTRGSSGSVLWGLNEGKALGLHFGNSVVGGTPPVLNAAIPATVLKRLLKSKLAIVV